MRVLMSFLAGIVCAAALMFQLTRTHWLAPDALAVSDAGRLPSSPAALPRATATPAPPRSASEFPIVIAVPAVETPMALPERKASALLTPEQAISDPADPARSGVASALADVPLRAVSGLLIPVQGVQPADLRDTFAQARSVHREHAAIDIMAARGTPVLAVNPGRVIKLFTSKPGGLTVYQFDLTEQVIYYYAHLDSYAPGLAEGQHLQRGDVVGTVGSTGNASADAPHLHFELQLPGPEKQWWHTISINPYGRFEGQQ